MADTTTLQGKFQSCRDWLNAGLIQRQTEVDLCLLGMIAREHVLLVGEPGTAKSLLIDRLTDWLAGGQRFKVQLNRFSTPDLVFGPLSLKALKEDRYERAIKGKLPEAHLAYIDEIFKANSAVLNSLLQVLNERQFDNGNGKPVSCPLVMCLASSNEFPTGEDKQELGALYDRFLFRRLVKPVSGWDEVTQLVFDLKTPVMPGTIAPGELRAAHDQAMSLPWRDEAIEAYLELLKAVTKDGILVGDRRKIKARYACQAAAWLTGAAAVEAEHLWVLAHILWEDPDEQPDVVARHVGKLASPLIRLEDLNCQALETARSVVAHDVAGVVKAMKALKDIAGKMEAVSTTDTKAKERLITGVKEMAMKIKKDSLKAIK